MSTLHCNPSGLWNVGIPSAEEAESVLSSTGITAEERKQYKIIIEKLEEFFMVWRNVIRDLRKSQI